MHTPIAFPDATSLADVLPDVSPSEPCGDFGVLAEFPGWDREDQTFQVGGYLSIKRRGCGGPSAARIGWSPESWRVNSLPQRLKDYIRDEMLHVENDRTSFEIVVRGDGSALLLIRHSQIIGSRWLALFPAETLPEPATT